MSYGYVPAPPPPVPQKSWFSRNRKWFLPTIILGPLLLLALFVSVIFGAVFGMMKSSEPYKYAVATASHDARISEQLGTPITPGWFVSGNIHVEIDSGDCEMTIPLNGKRRHGTVYVEAKEVGRCMALPAAGSGNRGRSRPCEPAARDAAGRKIIKWKQRLIPVRLWHKYLFHLVRDSSWRLDRPDSRLTAIDVVA